MIFRQMSQSSI